MVDLTHVDTLAWLQNLAHHLIEAGQLEGLHQLLSDPSWLEAKLHAYGLASVVQDFRR